MQLLDGRVLADIQERLEDLFRTKIWLFMVNDLDPELAAVTRRSVLGELADEGADVIVGHFRGVGRLQRAGKGFRWAVE